MILILPDSCYAHVNSCALLAMLFCSIETPMYQQCYHPNRAKKRWWNKNFQKMRDYQSSKSLVTVVDFALSQCNFSNWLPVRYARDTARFRMFQLPTTSWHQSLDGCEKQAETPPNTGHGPLPANARHFSSALYVHTTPRSTVRQAKKTFIDETRRNSLTAPLASPARSTSHD